MMSHPYEAVDAVYAKLPFFECQGKCQESCGPIKMSHLEWERILKTFGAKANTLPDDFVCPMLNRDTGQCSVYAIRPLVCRLYGMVEKMICPYGCRPLLWVSNEQATELLKELFQLSSHGNALHSD